MNYDKKRGGSASQRKNNWNRNTMMIVVYET
jgi:hypothetical protein